MSANKIIILGATGMLGQAMVKAARHADIEVFDVARSGAGINLDILDFNALVGLIKSTAPRVVVNCVAMTSLAMCEREPEAANLVNATLVEVLADVCEKVSSRLIHISTDHFFVGDGDKKHDENSKVKLVNNYAKTKLTGEKYALDNPNSLVVRTNIVGFRNRGNPTFVEWALESLKKQQEITVFRDFYTSSIDVYQFSSILLKLINEDRDYVRGVVNIASSEVSSKEQFIKRLASTFGFKNAKLVPGSVVAMTGAKRAESLGLKTCKIETLLAVRMPTLNEVIESLYFNGDNYVSNQ